MINFVVAFLYRIFERYPYFNAKKVSSTCPKQSSPARGRCHHLIAHGCGKWHLCCGGGCAAVDVDWFGWKTTIHDLLRVSRSICLENADFPKTFGIFHSFWCRESCNEFCCSSSCHLIPFFFGIPFFLGSRTSSHLFWNHASPCFQANCLIHLIFFASLNILGSTSSHLLGETTQFFGAQQHGLDPSGGAVWRFDQHFFHIFSPFQLDHWIGFGTIYRNPLFFGGVFPWFPVHFPKKTHQPWMEHQTARRQKTSWHLLRSWAMPKGHQAWHGHPNGHAIARLQMNCGFQKMGILIFSKDWKVNRKDRTGDFLGHFFGRFWLFF